MRIKCFWVLTGIFLMSGCEIVATRSVTRASAMHESSNILREQFLITSLESQAVVPYGPVKMCLYREQVKSVIESAKMRQLGLSIKTVGKRLLVVMRDEAQEPSSYLMSANGKVYDFNAKSRLSSERETSDNYQAIAIRTRRSIEAKNDPRLTRVHVVNEFSVRFPEYTATSLQVGRSVVVIAAENGAPWAEYIFRGTTVFRGVRAGLLDLVREQEGYPQFGKSIVGFSIVDLATMLPLLVVLDSGSVYQFERISCAK